MNRDWWSVPLQTRTGGDSANLQAGALRGDAGGGRPVEGGAAVALPPAGDEGEDTVTAAYQWETFTLISHLYQPGL